jgi:hypothetical protein
MTPRGAFFHRNFPHSAGLRELNGASGGMPLYCKVCDRELWGCRTNIVKGRKAFSWDWNPKFLYYLNARIAEPPIQ